jgi:NTP pyrophosphatase (non-canonical NTP hydrolase)
MRVKLAIRRHHGKWRDLTVGEVLYRLIAETHELNDAIRVLFNDPDRGETNRESVIGEAVDVAAYCAMLIDVLSMEDER